MRRDRFACTDSKTIYNDAMDNMDTTTQHLDRAIEAAGGITKLAAALGVKGHQVIHQWRLKRVPAERCPAIERVTAGVVRCEQLRPDVDWAVLRAGDAVSESV